VTLQRHGRVSSEESLAGKRFCCSWLR
jgi:hypothetical protein